MRRSIKNLTTLFGLAALSLASISYAQMPADAINLGKLKIAEKVKPADLDPVTLEASKPDGPTWEYEGVQYRGSKPDSKDLFLKDPAIYAKKAAEERWVKNFIESMSKVWCPVTDEVNPGGLKQWVKDGITWESCCAFCDDSVADEDFVKGLDVLTARARKSFELTGGKYIEGAASPIEDAIDESAAKGKKDTTVAAAAPGAVPEWMKGKTLKPTYAEGAGLIIEQRCVECHMPGGAAPMSFMNYGETLKWKKGFKNAVVERSMPPWPADPKIGQFAHAKVLTQEEIDLLSKWADAGFPQGEGSFAPKVPPAPAPTDAKTDPLANKSFVLPAGAEKVEVKSQFTFAGAGSVLAVSPQSGRRLKSVAVAAIDAAGKRTELLSIPHWEPDYTFRYELATPLKVAKGTVIEAVWVFDNSKLNAKNPNPGVEVKAGDASGEVAEGRLEYKLD